MIFFFFWPYQGLNLGPWQSKPRVLTTGPPGNSQQEVILESNWFNPPCLAPRKTGWEKTGQLGGALRSRVALQHGRLSLRYLYLPPNVRPSRGQARTFQLQTEKPFLPSISKCGFRIFSDTRIIVLKMQLGKTPGLCERDTDTCYYIDVGPKPIKHKRIKEKIFANNDNMSKFLLMISFICKAPLQLIRNRQLKSGQWISGKV